MKVHLRSSITYDCILIGAGIAALSAAEQLRANGCNIVLLEKSRSPGGRMATRYMDGATLDHGAQFITARAAYLKQKLQQMVDTEQAVVWHSNRHGTPRYRGEIGMRSISQWLGREIPILTQRTVTRLDYQADRWSVLCDSGETFHSRRVLATIPTPQLLTLLASSNYPDDTAHLEALKAIVYAPTLALLAVLKEPSTMPPPGILKLAEHPVLATITDNRVKGISARPALTLHSSLPFAQTHLEDLSTATADKLIQAAQAHIQFSIENWVLHRWRYAQCTQRHHEDYVRFRSCPLWLAGDAFGNARLEQAALSGVKAAQSMIAAQ